MLPVATGISQKFHGSLEASCLTSNEPVRIMCLSEVDQPKKEPGYNLFEHQSLKVHTNPEMTNPERKQLQEI